jgi:Ca2+-binding EF-hand superfamily protein
MVIFNIDTLILIEYVKLNLGNGMITIDEFIQLMETQESRVKYDIKELREQFRLFDKVGF